ncbi:MAG: SGNH/GDSL hydrolase family protein [Blautia sp.]|nr:SGNH/GDSL hydrolase family protein [Blautia sp.]
MKKGQEQYHYNIPELEVIDLEDTESSAGLSAEDGQEQDDILSSSGQPDSKKRFPHINIHIVLLVVFIAFIVGIAYKIMNFGTYVDLEELFRDGQGTYDDTLDGILPLMDADGHRLETNYDDGLTIVAFGNSPFADDRDSDDNLVNMIREMTGATVYNCSVSGSYLASQSSLINGEDSPMDVYTFYWLSLLTTSHRDAILRSYNMARENLGDNVPPDADEVVNTLSTLDFNTVDVVVVMYDATDYLQGHQMYNDLNRTDIEQFTGNLEAGIEIFQNNYPHIRIIVLSPPYAFSDQLDEHGDYISSDIARYGWDVLSTYVIKEFDSCAWRSVTFVDNLYGTITEDNARKYLVDNLHLNTAGRQEIAKRFAYALYYYDQDQIKDK